MERAGNVLHHLGALCSDKVLMHINRPSNFQQTLELSLQDLSLGLYTDVTLVPEDGTDIKIHGFLLSAASPFLSDLFSKTFSPNLEHRVLLPGVSSESVAALCQLLYGSTVLVSRDNLVQLYRLIDILAIQLSLALQETIEPSSEALLPEEESLTSPTNLKEEEEDKREPVRMLKIDDKNNISDSTYPVAEEEVNTSGNNDFVEDPKMPVCCWHCSKDFSSFPRLSEHVKTCHQGHGRPGQRRHHRCARCGQVLSSMWKLRQHLSHHHQQGGAIGEGVGDHQYGRTGRLTRTVIKRQGGDHGYATAQEAKPTPKEENEEETTIQKYDERTPPGSVVCSEHSYGTKRDSSPETEDRPSSRHEITDHLYSSASDPPDESLGYEQNGGHLPICQEDQDRKSVV